jgi:hypothetical protein
MTILKHLLLTYLSLKNTSGQWCMVRIESVLIWELLVILARWAKKSLLPDIPTMKT